MGTAASGVMSEAIEYARITLAECDAWRAWVGASTQAQALSRIFHLELPPPKDGNAYTKDELQRLHPYALVWQDPETGCSLNAIAQGARTASGVVHVKLVDGVDEDLSDKTPELVVRMANRVGAIMGEILDLAEQAGYLAVVGIPESQGPWLTPREQEYGTGGEIWQELHLAWGMSG